MDDSRTIVFPPDSMFYDVTNTIMAALCGLLIFRPEFSDNLDKLNERYDGRVLGIESYIHKDGLMIKPKEMIDLLKNGYLDLGKTTNNLFFMTINISYEKVKDLLSSSNPEHEFFRHLRNAASHDGTWTFKNNEPVRAAEWRKWTVVRELQGKPLFSIGLKPGDLFVLLSDIEKSIPSITSSAEKTNTPTPRGV